MWNIFSNSGADTITCSEIRPLDGDPRQLACSLAITTELGAGRSLEHRVELPQLVVSRAALEHLQSSLEAWLVDEAPFAVDLGVAPGQQLRLEVGPVAHVISSRSHPALVVRYAGVSRASRSRRARCALTSARSMRRSVRG